MNTITRAIMKHILIFMILVSSIGVSSAAWYDVDSLIFVDDPTSKHKIDTSDNIFTNFGVWNLNQSVPNTGYLCSPTIFKMGTQWYMLTDSPSGLKQYTTGFRWTGTTWVIDTTINGGIAPVSGKITPDVFYEDGSFRLIVGHSDGDFVGYTWNGGTWVLDHGVKNGLIDIGTYSAIEVFKWGNKLHAILTRYQSGHLGKEWDGSAWIDNNTIVTGMGYYGLSTSLSVFEINNEWYMTAGYASNLDAVKWNGTSWVSSWNDSDTFLNGIPINIDIMSNDVVDMDGIITSISSNSWQNMYQCDFKGFYKYTNYTAVSLLETELHINTNNRIDTDLIDFNILSGVLDNFTVTNVTTDRYYQIFKDSLNIQTCRAENNNVTFTANLDIGNYEVYTAGYEFNATGIHGFVYEGIIGSQNPLKDVVITITNASWSDITISDPNGYYVFTNLTNTTYTLNFKKDRYIPINHQYVTPVNLSMYEKNMYMQRATGDYYSRHYCTFILKDYFGNRYNNVDVIVYEDSIITTAAESGYDGGVVFHLFEDTEYRITFINLTQNIDKEIYVFPKDNTYTIYVTDYSLTPNDDIMDDHVMWWYTKNEINLTHSWLNFSYRDVDKKTTFIEYWVNNSTNSNLFYTSHANPTDITDYTSNNIINSSNHTYLVHFSAVHPDYPSLANSGLQTVSFYSKKLIDLLFSEQWHYTATSVCLIIFVALLFGATNVSSGAIIVCLTAWSLSFIQWLPISTIGYGALVLATILSVTYSMRKNEVLRS